MHTILLFKIIFAGSNTVNTSFLCSHIVTLSARRNEITVVRLFGTRAVVVSTINLKEL